MDFSSLTRRELQALCKRNKIPANITNVAMADALAALPLVEGIEEFLNGEESGVPESPMKEEIVCSEIPRTALRSSTRRKAVKDEPKSSQPLTRTRRAAAARGAEEPENKDINVALTTPSLPSGRRRTAAAATSACKKVDFQMTVDVEKEDNDLNQEKNVIEKTPAVPKSQKRVAAASTRKRTETRNNGAAEQRAYSTRRSVRLLEKNMESLSLAEDRKMEPITIHMSFDEMPNSTGLANEDTNLEMESKKTDESESKLDEDLELENDDHEKNEMETEVKLPEAEPEMDPDSSICSAENLVSAKICDDSETETDAPNLDVKCFSEVEGSEEASKDDDAVEISAEDINDSDKLSLPTEDVDPTEVHNLAIIEESSTEVEAKQNESTTCESENVIGEDSEEEAKLMNNSVELPLPYDLVDEETQVDDVLSSVEESVMKVKDGQKEYVYGSEPTIGEEDLDEKEEVLDADIEGDKKEMDTVSVQAEDDTMKSVEFSENVSEDLVDVLSSVEESVMKVKDGQKEVVYGSEPTIGEEDLDEKGEVLDADIEGDKKEMDTVSVQAEDDTMKSVEFSENVSEDLVDVKIQWQMGDKKEMDTVSVQAGDDTMKSVEFCENVSEDLVDVKIQWQMEKAPKEMNDARNSQPKIPNDQKKCQEALVEVSVTSTEEIILPTSSNISGVVPLAAPFAADQLASQFPRPTVTKSPLKEQTIRLLMDNSDAEDEDEKEKEKEDCIQRQMVEKNDMSLRQLRKMFKEQLQLSKKKLENNTKVGKVRTALQPLPENRMGMDELEKRF